MEEIIMENRIYVCIDLKSFYASVECVERGLNPMTENLVVADPDRTEKTICLAVSPAMKKLGVPGRCRVFQIPKDIEYIMAPPRMQLYIDYSSKIYGIYLKYISKEDIHVYSIDEVFMDVTDYLSMYHMNAKKLSILMMKDVEEKTGITAACGIGPNLYLAKIALDILAKHSEDHIAVLDENSYREILWRHRPLTDFWRVGKGTEQKLAHAGIFTMEDITKVKEELLYQMFGIDAELLIDHAWGKETATMADIKQYRPKESSVSAGQVLEHDYFYDQGKIIVKEMADNLCLEMVEKHLVTDSVTLHVGYSECFQRKAAHGTAKMTIITSSSKKIMDCVLDLYKKIVDPYAWIRRITLTFNHVMDEQYEQCDLFTDPLELEKERKIQKAVLEIKTRFGKNALLRGMDLQKEATTMERNCQIGGHKSGI